MALTPITRQSVPEAVFEQLVSGIVAGELEPGEALPSERALAEALKVSRPAVREALQRLAHAGLVDIRQGGATTVRDYRRTAGLDLLTRVLVDRDGNVDLGVARDVVTVRVATGPHVARLAAERADDRQAARLVEAARQMRTSPDDPVVLQRRALAFWDLVVDATGNVVYRLMFNALSAAYEPVMDALAQVLRAEVSDVEGFLAVARAVARHEPDAAEAATRRILEQGTAATLEVLDQLLDGSTDTEEPR